MIGDFFRHWTQVVTVLAELSPQGSQSCILGVQINISRRKTQLKKVVFLISFFGFCIKVLKLFSKNFWSSSKKAFYVSKGTVCGKQWVKKAKKQKIFGEFFDKSRTLMENFRPFLSKLHSTCQATFRWKAAFAIEILIGKFFWHCAQTLKVLAKLLPHRCKNCFLRA